MSQACTGQIVAQVGPIVITAVGASVTALNAATIILATGGAVGLVLAGYGVYRYLAAAADMPRRPLPRQRRAGEDVGSNKGWPRRGSR